VPGLLYSAANYWFFHRVDSNKTAVDGRQQAVQLHRATISKLFCLFLLCGVLAASGAAQTNPTETPQKTATTQRGEPGKAATPDLSLEPAPVLPQDLGPLNYVPMPGPAPLLTAPPPPPAPPLQGTVRERSIESASEVIKVILGLVVIFGLAYLAGNPRIQALEQKLQITQVVTAGLPFVFLGLIAHQQPIGVLSAPVLWQIRPLLALGLGWIGFTVGFRFDSKLGDTIHPGASAASLITTSVPFVTILAVCALLLVYVEHFPANAIFLRDAMMLATAGAMTAYGAPKLLEARGAAGATVDRLNSLVTLEQLAGFVGLLIVAAYFRPQDLSVAWHLPGTAWLFITIGMGTMVGAVIWVTLSKVKAGPEFTLLILGSVCFTAGMASFLRISPLVVCFIVGLILVNLPGTSKAQIREALEHMERPIYLLFLLVAGSLWDVTAWQGWALMVLFVLARLVGKWIAVTICRKRVPGGLSPDEQRSIIFSPIGALSIAIIVNAQDLYFGSTVSWMVTAVIGGAIVTEIIVQIASRRMPVEEPHLIGIS
jgi:hypothetical protein